MFTALHNQSKFDHKQSGGGMTNTLFWIRI